VDDGRLQIVEVPQHLVDAHRPLRAELEVVAAGRHLELVLDRGALFIECKPRRSTRIGGEEQDHVFSRGRHERRNPPVNADAPSISCFAVRAC
jgi:hypothetical protein